MKYLVTGGAGFIGSHIVEYLLGAGHQVTVIDDLSTGREENLAPFASRIRFLKGGVEEPGLIDEAMEGIEGVFHQAAIPSVPRSIAQPLQSHVAIVEATLVILEALRKRGGGRFVMASSSSVYGESEELPKHEMMRTDPLSPYAAAKLAAENYAIVYSRLYDIKAIALRYFNVFGPRQDPNSEYAAVVPKFIRRALRGEEIIVFGDGQQSRDFTYVENVVKANILAMESPVRTARLNIGVGVQVTLLEMIAALSEILGKQITPRLDPPRNGDIKHSFAAIKAARETIGYEPVVDFREGLRRTAEHLKKLEAGK